MRWRRRGRLWRGLARSQTVGASIARARAGSNVSNVRRDLLNRGRESAIACSMGDVAEQLYDEVIKLPPRERRMFALRLLASVPEESEQAEQGATASWETIESLRGVVHLGGNAVEDCDSAALSVVKR